jgi:hypothetical protein
MRCYLEFGAVLHISTHMPKIQILEKLKIACPLEHSILFSSLLTPKDQMSIQRTNWFWAASIDLISFLGFLKVFVNMRLRISFVGVQIS